MGDPVDAPGGDGTLKRKWVAKAYETCRSMKSRSVFRKTYRKIQDSRNEKRRLGSTRLALIYVICAIGAYYTSFTGKDSGIGKLHEVYFLHALSLTAPAVLLFIGGLHNRQMLDDAGPGCSHSQSIGMHVENRAQTTSRARTSSKPRIDDECGRPPAIHDYDCHVPLPSRTGDSDIDWDGTHLATAEEDSSSTIDYFLALIAFSGIVGHALRDLYGPKRNQRTTDDLCNMLAIKFHHLRALIYRPYLSYPLLRHLDDANVGLMQTDWSVISFYEKRCVMEARETARLMYGISSEEALVHDFPWWQMISSLICSGSILLVSSIFTQPADDTFAEYADALSDDAETCLKVFEALSINSTGARIARNMTERLRECSVKWRQATCTSLPAHSPPNLHGQHISLSEGVVPIPQDWPAEIVDSMAGSAQFSGAVQSGWQL
ncbi:hypothetical protein NCS56_00001800 [Fusarium sp. Ph1]|nr:hypothetical protein NCS56_00001800 [Fusarium sp. Ph1]